MKTFIFRNNTIDYFFDKDATFSGYEDISEIPNEVNNYIWFYQVPIGLVNDNIIEKIHNYVNMLDFVISKIKNNNPFIIFTLASINNYKIIKNDYRLEEAIYEFNNHIYNLGQKFNNIKIIDFNLFINNYKQFELIDWRFYFTAQIPLNPILVNDFKIWYKRQLEEINFIRKKCIVLDLDNTLWGGILGEDGITGIKIGGDYPGKVFLEFQKVLLDLSKKGVLLAICSKNNEVDVLNCWNKNSNILINNDIISAKRINWNNKADNIREIANELNIGLDSFIFIDDNPTERALIKKELPMIECPDFPEKPYLIPDFIQEIVNKYFSVYNITNEDLEKTKEYKENIVRNKEKCKFTDLNSFIKSLNINLIIESINDLNKTRICQMIQKTNQFNLTTIRYTEAEINNLMKSGAYIYCISVNDKFGDNGITGCIIIEQNEIKEFLLSCRILGKDIEYAFINEILFLLKNKGINKLNAQYIPTLKNSQVEMFYEKCDFEMVENKNNIKYYIKDLEKFVYKKDNRFNIIIKE